MRPWLVRNVGMPNSNRMKCASWMCRSSSGTATTLRVVEILEPQRVGDHAFEVAAQQRAVLAAGNQLACVRVFRKHRQHVPDQDLPLGSLGGLHHPLAVRHRQRHRLFAQHVLAVFQRLRPPPRRAPTEAGRCRPDPPPDRRTDRPAARSDSSSTRRPTRPAGRNCPGCRASHPPAASCSVRTARRSRAPATRW